MLEFFVGAGVIIVALFVFFVLVWIVATSVVAQWIFAFVFFIAVSFAIGDLVLN